MMVEVKSVVGAGPYGKHMGHVGQVCILTHGPCKTSLYFEQEPARKVAIYKAPWYQQKEQQEGPFDVQDQ